MRARGSRFLWLIVSFALVAPQSCGAPREQSRPHGTKVAVAPTSIRIMDGDTAEIHWSRADVETVRVLGIDTPELFGSRRSFGWNGPWHPTARARRGAGLRARCLCRRTAHRAAAIGTARSLPTHARILLPRRPQLLGDGARSRAGARDHQRVRRQRIPHRGAGGDGRREARRARRRPLRVEPEDAAKPALRADSTWRDCCNKPRLPIRQTAATLLRLLAHGSAASGASLGGGSP